MDKPLRTETMTSEIPWALIIALAGVAVSYGVIRAQVGGLEKRMDRVEDKLAHNDETMTQAREQFAEIKALMVNVDHQLKSLHDDLRAIRRQN